MDYPHLVQAIEDAWPGNTNIQTWLEAYAAGQANVPTAEQIQQSIQILQQPFWDFDNPSPPVGSGPDFSELTAQFYKFWTDLGFDPTNNPAAIRFQRRSDRVSERLRCHPAIGGLGRAGERI
ncbi:hypothetical protein [Mycobacterium sp.]|uniref:hypothetical protein n=1 Tax=Mycobacterium sp. TaxID=1785 RepID=UPI003C755625